MPIAVFVAVARCGGGERMSVVQDTRRPGTAPAILFASIVCALVVTTVIALGEPLLGLADPIARNYNEGWNAIHARAAVGGGNLYPAPGATVVNNYPPLSFYLVGAIGSWTGDALIAGRVVAFLSLVVVALAIACIVVGLTGSRMRGALASTLTLAWFAMWFPHYVAMNDPQMSGHALQYVGLALLVRHGTTRAGLLGSMACMLLGGLIKHVLLPVPIGVALWLFGTRRRDFLVWFGAAVLGVGVALAWMAVAFGAPLFEGILLHERATRAHLFVLSLQNWFVPLTPLLAGATASLVVGAARLPRTTVGDHRRGVRGGGALRVLRGGRSYNAVFDLTFACVILCVATRSIACSCARDALRGQCGTRRCSSRSLTANLLVSAPLRSLRLVEAAQVRSERVEQARADLDFVRASAGPLLCENAALAHWSGKGLRGGLLQLRSAARDRRRGRTSPARTPARTGLRSDPTRPGGRLGTTRREDRCSDPRVLRGRSRQPGEWLVLPSPRGGCRCIRRERIGRRAHN
jgi:hypothetical protein